MVYLCYMGDQRISAAEFRAKIDSGEFAIGKKGRIVASPKAFASPAPSDEPKKAKYGNIKVPDPEMPSKPFDSKLEAKHGKEYRLLAKLGEIITVTRQPKFLLQGGVVYIADFLILHNDYSVEVVDSKGVVTPDFRNKEKLFRAMYPTLKFTVRSK